jgi:2-iminobutanoate/2-iminopropanoate deaminase
MNQQRIATEAAPAALGPYSQAIVAGDYVFCSGQLGLDPATGELAEGLAAQADRALRNLGAVLEAAGCSHADIVKTTVFLADMADFAALNEVYAGYFGAAPPARSTFAVKALPKAGLLEIEAVAYRPRAGAI